MMHTNSHRGFTLIEALVAITILLLAIAGPMTLASEGIKNSIHARDKVTAFYIAQEGVEMIRAIRDTNALEGEVWDADIDGACFDSDEWCGIDIETLDNNNMSPANGDYHDCNIDSGGIDATCAIFLDPTGYLRTTDDSDTGESQRGIFTHDNKQNDGVRTEDNEGTIYKRALLIEEIVAGREYMVRVRVEWNSRGTTKSLEVTSRIFDQYDNL